MTTFVRFIIVTIVVIGVIFALRTLRPRLREQRHRRWEKAGLLPHQVDPYAPPETKGEDHATPRDTRR